MNRRELLQRSSLILGGTLMGADSLLAKNIDWDAMDDDLLTSKGYGMFTKQQIKLMNEIADTIIPDTDVPGAKAAKTGQFMAVIVNDCYEPDEQKRFMEGLAKIDEGSKQKNKKTFVKCSPMQRHEFLVALDNEQKAYQKNKKKEDVDHYFKVLKDLSLWGYFTSEIGATKAQRFLEVPGRYGTIDYKKGDRSWGGY